MNKESRQCKNIIGPESLPTERQFGLRGAEFLPILSIKTT